jgi:2-polyprenyl-3-methyl-5-hydroxy-6-metoxy-1,4-benzoquinol methylase
VTSEPPRERAGGIDYERLYEFRFRNVSQAAREAVWREIAAQVYGWLGRPQRVLDVAAGRGEFITAVPAAERWAIDAVDYLGDRPDVHSVVGDARTADLPKGHFDGVFVSNFLEHLDDSDEIGAFLKRLRRTMSSGGRIAILGPNFRYCAREYFDCADHSVALTHLAVEEHLYAAGFTIDRVVARYLPYSFRGRLPAAPWLVRSYLQLPLAWKLIGKQYFLLATNEDQA